MITGLWGKKIGMIAVHAQGGVFVGDKGMKARRFQPGTRQLRVDRWIEGGQDGDEIPVMR